MSEIKAGAADQSIEFVLLDATTGEPATGLTIADLDASYARTRSAAVQNALTALSAVTDAHADNQAIEVHDTIQPGVYRVDFPDAAFAAGAAFVTLVITGAAIKPSHRNFSLVVNTAEDVYTRLGAPAGASVSADLAAAKADTAAILEDTGTDIPATLATLATAANLATVASYLDTEIVAILEDTGTTIPALIAALPTAESVWDEVVDGATTARESMRLQNSALGGKASGLATATAVFRDLADTKDRITATVDADGNRTSVVRDLS
jgi:5-hydroxyisourate hydrolase-like protein (transthyretin family)